MSAKRVEAMKHIETPSAELYSFPSRIPLSEAAFQKTIALERKRTERSTEPFILMLVDGGDQHGSLPLGPGLTEAISHLMPTIRATDVVGWYQEHTSLGVIFTGLHENGRSEVLSAILDRVSEVFRKGESADSMNHLRFSFYVYPDDWEPGSGGIPPDNPLYPEIHSAARTEKSMRAMKRSIDVLGGTALLLMGLPLFLLIAIAIKLTSRGPVFFRQERLGQGGKRFTFLKFRSMHVDNDHSVHREYVKQLIAGNGKLISVEGSGEKVFKLANDERITPIGRLLRRTSLDEMPQFLNVIRGDMSLVGPRPPIPYEFGDYRLWHRRRLLHVKPGITGLWQVNGRSRVNFDEMVRLDLQYAATWSPWMDIKILLQTPRAVIHGAF